MREGCVVRGGVHEGGRVVRDVCFFFWQSVRFPLGFKALPQQTHA